MSMAPSITRSVPLALVLLCAGADASDGARTPLPPGNGPWKPLEPALSEAQVAEAEADKPRRRVYPRYLLGHSGFTLPPGEVEWRQTELLLTTIEVGLTESVSITTGGIAPGFFMGVPNVILGAKFTLPLTERIRIAGGMEGLLAATLTGQPPFLATLPWLATTVGEEFAHLTVSWKKGVATALPPPVAPLGADLAAFSGSIEVTPGVAFMTEHAFIIELQNGSPLVGGFHLFGLRFQNKVFSPELGVAIIGSYRGYIAFVPLPLLNLSWRFEPAPPPRAVEWEGHPFR